MMKTMMLKRSVVMSPSPLSPLVRLSIITYLSSVFTPLVIVHLVCDNGSFGGNCVLLYSPHNTSPDY